MIFLRHKSCSTQGYEAVPSSSTNGNNYGSTSGAPVGGLQVLPADATKIEPKVWLASERTFLNWLRVALLLSSFALALFNSGDKLAKWMGFTYAVIAVGMLGYAWLMHERRRTRIITRYAGHHGQLNRVLDGILVQTHADMFYSSVYQTNRTVH